MAGSLNSQWNTPHPDLTPGLFGEGRPGTGTWLYGAVLDWEQTHIKKHKQMLKDVKKMIAIRKQESDLIYAHPNSEMPPIQTLQYNCGEKIPVPYIM